ncbi:MAG: heme ABC transporter permease CcmC [Maricaulaceae bacterium]|jgi:heme exporter protein C
MIAYLANPERFMRYSRPAALICAALAVVLIGWAMYAAFFVAPEEADQGDFARILFIHAPSAWVCMAAYAALGVASFTYLVWRHSLADSVARAIAPLGAVFTFMMLVTGSIWGRPTWGTWWEWDGRMASALMLLIQYLGYMALRASIEDERQSARAGAILGMVGLIWLPIIKYSVDWWATLHQGASVDFLNPSESSMDPRFLGPLLASFAGYSLLFASLVLVRTRSAVFRRRVITFERARERAA